MINYETYKILHVFTLLMVLNIVIVALFKIQTKKYKNICIWVSCLAVFIAVYSAVTKLA